MTCNFFFDFVRCPCLAKLLYFLYIRFNVGHLNAIRVSSVRYYYYTGPYGECNEFSVHFARPRVHMYACKSIEYETLSLSTPSSSQYRIFLLNATKRALTFGRKASRWRARRNSGREKFGRCSDFCRTGHSRVHTLARACWPSSPPPTVG